MPGRAAEWCYLRAQGRAVNAFAEAWGHFQRAPFGRDERGPDHLRVVLEAAGRAARW